jgi:hypothetical protein
MDQTEARAFAERWVTDWNAHDVDALLKHFTDDVVFTSPVAIRVLGGDGVIRGKDALRTYWSEGIRLIPDLHFEVLAVYVGISTLVINYRNQAGGVVSEVLTFDGALVREGHGTYLAQVLGAAGAWVRAAVDAESRTVRDDHDFDPARTPRYLTLALALSEGRTSPGSARSQTGPQGRRGPAGRAWRPHRRRGSARRRTAPRPR